MKLNFFRRFLPVILLFGFPLLEIYGQDQDEINFAIDPESSMENFYALAEMALRESPAHQFSVPAAQKELGDDPRDLYQWVRDETRLIPYQGILRGSQGVIVDRMGNSLDRAILLHDMLHEAGISEVRFVRATLDLEDSEALWKSISRDPSPHYFDQLKKEDSGELEVAIEEAARILQADPQAIRFQLEQDRYEGQILAEKMASSIDFQSEEIAGQIDISRNGNGDGVSQRKAIEDLRDHWWIEYRAEGEWTTLDPASAEISFGKQMFPEKEEERFAYDDLSSDLWHRMDVRVIAEQLTESGLHTVTALEETVIAASLPFRHVDLSMAPINWGSLDLEAKVSDIREKALAQNEWLPVLKVEGESIIQSSIRADGTLNKTPLQDSRSRAMQSATGALGQIGRRGREEKPQTELSAVWMEITLRGPGLSPQVHQRMYTDLIGPARRIANEVESFTLNEEKRLERALGLFEQSSFYLQTHWPSPEWVNHQMLLNLVHNRTATMGILNGVREENAAMMESSFAQQQILPIQLYQIGMSRWAHHPAGFSTFPSGINLIRQSDQIRPGANEESLIFQYNIDILSNQVKALPGKVNPASLSFQQGIVDTHVEHYWQEEKNESITRVNAAYQFGLDQLVGMDWQRVEEVEMMSSLKKQFSRDTVVRWQKLLEEGNILLVRPEPLLVEGSDLSVPLWWAWNPDRQTILGYGGEGLGQTTDYLTITGYVISAITGTMGAVDCIANSSSGKNMACCLAKQAVISGVGLGIGKLFSMAALGGDSALGLIAGLSFEAGSLGLNTSCE